MQLLIYELKFLILARFQPFHYMPQLEGSFPPLYLRDTLMSSSYGHLQDWPKILLKLEYLPKYCQNWNIYQNTVSVHCREEGCIGKYIPRGPRDFPRAWILHPEAREISRGRSPREISRAEGGVFPNASRLEAVYVHSLSISREVLILWCVFIWNLKDLPHSASACTEWALHQPKLL